MVDTKLTLLSAQGGDADLPSEVGMRHGVAKFWDCHISTGKMMTTLHLEWEELGIRSLRKKLGSLGPETTGSEVMSFLHVCFGSEGFSLLSSILQNRSQHLQDGSACAMHQEC